jgi:hypothetical protein
MDARQSSICCIVFASLLIAMPLIGAGFIVFVGYKYKVKYRDRGPGLFFEQ